MNMSNLVAPQVSAISATCATSCTPPTPTPSSPSTLSPDLLQRQRHAHLRPSLDQDSGCSHPYGPHGLPPNHPPQTASSGQPGSDRSGTQRSQDDRTQPPVLIHMGSARRDGSEGHPGYSPHRRHDHGQPHSHGMEMVSSEEGCSRESRRPRAHSAAGYQRFRHPEDGCYFEQHSPPPYLQQEPLQEQSDSPLNHVDAGFGSRAHSDCGRDSLVAQADCNGRSIGATWPLASKSDLDCHGKDHGNGIAAPHSIDSKPSSAAPESPHLTTTPLPLPPTTTSTAGALWLSASNVPWNRSSLRNEISSDSPPTPASASAFPSPASTVHASTNRSNAIHSALSSGHSAWPTSPTPSPPLKTAAVRAPPFPPNPTKAPLLASPPLRYPSSPTNPLPEFSKTPAMPVSASSSPTQSGESRSHATGGVSSGPTFDQLAEADTRSTSAADTGQRRGATRSGLQTEGDQEVPRTAAAGAARQGEHSGIMGAGAYHASVTAAVTAATGGEGGRRNEAAAGAGAASTSARYPLATTSTSKNPHQHRHFEPHCTSSPPPAPQFRQEYPRQHEQQWQQQQQQQHAQSHPHDASSEGPRRIAAEGTSVSSLSSSMASQPFAAGTPDPTALTRRPSSPSMNNHPLTFDQTGQRPFHSDSNSPGGLGDSALSNKRRSLADLLFVPTKNIKTKEKRNSGSASSVSSVESYRQDEGSMEHHSGWAAHAKSASGATASSNSSASAPAQRSPLEPQQASPPLRKASIAKGTNRGAGGATSAPKTFQCTGYPGCNMVFTRSEHLARHERKHTGEKPYKCIVSNCPRTFSRYDNMIQHTQTHGDRSRRDSLAAVAAVGNASRSRSSSLHSTPLLTGRPRGGSSPVVFGPGYEDVHHRSLDSSPASTSYIGGSPLSQHQHRHPYTPQHQQQHHHPQQQQYQHPMQWTFPSGAPASSSPSLLTSRSSGSSGIVYNGDAAHFQYESNAPTTVVRTLKANSRSLPHLQPRSSLGASADSPSMGPQQDMSNMEIEELKRRKSELLLPSSSYSGGKAAASGSSYIQGQGQAIGLGMSPFAASSTHPSQPLPHVETLTPQEQERLHEHRRSAQAVLSTVRTNFGPTERRATPESSGRNSLSSTPGFATGGSGHSRSESLGPALPIRQDLSFAEKNRLLEHRNSTPELMYDAMRAKRSSNDPTDMNIQPLPSRDSRSGVQWFSQVNTPTMTSELPMVPRDIQVGAAPPASMTTHRGAGIDSTTILPPIARSISESEDDRQPRLRSNSSHIHPLSRPSSQSFGAMASPAWTPRGEAIDRFQFESTLSPPLERRLEEWYYPIRKREAQNAIEQMDTRDFLGLKTLVAKSYANEQFRNPEFLGNMSAILCVIRVPHPPWKNTDIRQASTASFRRSIDGGFARPRQSRRSMDADDVGGDSSDDQASNSNNDMDVDEQDSQEPRSTNLPLNIEQPCRYALDIDMDSLGRDPEPDLRAMEGLTISSLFPTKSFVAGFEPTMESMEGTGAEEVPCPKSLGGYPSNARIGRFYLPERAFRTPGSLNIHPDPNGPWVCCRFKEYRGVSIWVSESILESYHELSQTHKMALTLEGAQMYHRTAMYDNDEWEIHAGEQYDVKVNETMLYPEMIQQVWKDMHQNYVYQYQLRQRHQQQLQQQYKQRPSMQALAYQEGYSHQPPPHMASRVSTYEEYQKSLWQADPRRESYPNPHPRPSTGPYGDRRDYDEYRQHPQSLLHREDLSSSPSSPNSPRMDDFQEDNHAADSVSSTSGYHQEISSSAGPYSANMHRRISIAELCNPMQSLATERSQSSK